MKLKTLISTSLLSLVGSVGLVASQFAVAGSGENLWQAQVKSAEFFLPIATVNQQSVNYLMVSEQQGVALLDSHYQLLARLPNNAEHLDYRPLAQLSNKGLLATIDNNSGEVLLVQVDGNNNSLSIKHALSPKKTMFDAVCLSQKPYGIDLFTVDVLGEVVHYSIYRNGQGGVVPQEINRFPVGPNVKACAVDDTTGSLFITEENIGVWRYPTNPEHELIRTLVQLPPELEVEYVDTTAEGDIAIVSPSINTLWLYNQVSKAMSQVTLADHIAPKTVQLSRQGQVLTAFMFDDESETLVSQQVTKPTAALTNAAISATNSVEHTIASLPAFIQTEPVLTYGDAADDPAIWINASLPERSLVYGTDKKYGLNVYDLQGNLVKSLAVGRVNNVDIRYNVELNGERVDIAAASNRTNKSISLFAIDQQTGLPTHIAEVSTNLSDPYGLCMGQYRQQLMVWINDTDGRFQGYEIKPKGKQLVGVKTMEWLVPSQPEGCISDDAGQRLFYGEEAAGVWLKKLNTDDAIADQLIVGLNSQVAADIEGMSLYTLANKQYLVVSSQGNNRYAVYSVDDGNKFLGVFEVGVNWQKMIDGASETDGLAVTSQSLGSNLPYGLLVVQDGHNAMPKAQQNFKLVDGRLLHDWLVKRLAD